MQFNTALQRFLIFAVFLLIIFSANAQPGVAININGNPPDPSAILDISSVNKGLLIPRIDQLTGINDNTTIVNPASGLLIYTKIFNVIGSGPAFYYNSSTIPNLPVWSKVAIDNPIEANNKWRLDGNTGTNANINYIGTTDNQDVVFKRFGGTVARFYTGGAVVFTGDAAAGVTPVSGAGTRMMWNPAKAAFRAGSLSAIPPINSYWDDANIGQYSFAAGSGVRAKGNGAFAVGAGALADGDYSSATGYITMASGNYSFVAGSFSSAKGENSIAVGASVIANAYGSVAFGTYNVNTAANPILPQIGDKVLQVGVGTGALDRKDALYLTRAGNLVITGSLTANGINYPSDIRLKTAITPLQNVLNNIDNIQPITYYFKDKNNYPATHQIGFSAQEIEKEFPELVNKNEAGYLSVNYPQMTTVAIQAIKEQQEIIRNQEVKINQQQQQIDELKEQMKKVLQNNF